MKAITLRNISGKLAQAIEHKAEKMQSSFNRAVLRLLEERVGLTSENEKRRRYHDLDSLAGQWTKKDATVFEKVLFETRKIDKEIWK